MIVKKNDEKREITAPVMIPYYDDCDACRGEKQFTPEEIGAFMDGYMEQFEIVEPGHKLPRSIKDVGIPESWQLEEDTEFNFIDGSKKELPKGTWMMKAIITDDDEWEAVKKGEYTGFSVTVVDKSVADQIAAAIKNRVLIKDIPEPRAIGVALVDKPCVQDATFCSVKVATKSDKKESFEAKRDKISSAIRKKFGDDNYVQMTYDDKVVVHNWKEEEYYEIPYSIGLNDAIEFGEPVPVEQVFVAKKMLEMAEIAKKAGRSISDSTFNKLKNAWDSLGKLIDKANNEREEIPASKSDIMTNDDKKNKDTDDVVTKSELDTILDEKFEKQEDKLVEAVKAANETDEDKKKKKLDKIKKDLEDLGVDTSKIDLSTKESENDDDDDVVSKKEYDKVVEKNKEYAEQLGIEVESQSLKEDPNKDDVSTKSVSERVMASMNKTKSELKTE